MHETLSNLFTHLRARPLLILAVIVVAAFALRVFQLGDVPYGLHDDEVANTYVTKFILLNGVDIHGNSFPLLYFDKFGDFPPILPMYVSGLSALLFGSTVFGSRLLIATVGALTVIPMYYLALAVFRRKSTALFAAGVMAIAPWHVVLSRVNAEGIVALIIYTSAIALLFWGIKRRVLWQVWVSIGLLLASYFFYPSFRLIVPLTLLPATVLLFWDQIWAFLQRFFGGKKPSSGKKADDAAATSKSEVNDSSPFPRRFVVTLVAGLILAIGLTGYISSTEWGKGRFEQTSIFTEVSGVQILMNELIFNEDSVLKARIFNNKPLYFSRYFANNYFSYFTPEYLFLYGGEPPVYEVPNNGLFFVALGLLAAVGILGWAQRRNSAIDHRFFFYSIWLLAIAAIPAALTVITVPSIHRSIAMVPFFIIVFAYGFHALYGVRWRFVPLLAVAAVLLAGEFVLFAHNYFQHSSFVTSVYRSDGTKQLSDYLMEHQEEYDQVLVSNEERWYALYHLYYRDDFNPEYVGQFSEYDFRIDQIGTLQFPDTPCPTQEIFESAALSGSLPVSSNTLLVDKETCMEELTKLTRLDEEALPFTLVDEIPRKNGTTAFKMYTADPDFPYEEYADRYQNAAPQ